MERNKKILIAEDSPTQALHLQMILEGNNFDVIHGANGREALALLDEADLPDIVISDIVMPEMDGYEFCSRLKENEITKDIPVILLTQLSDPNDVIKGLQSSADNFISKPYSEEFLLERISDMLLNREMRRRSPNLDIALEIYFAGQKHVLNSNRLQILDLLLSTYYNAISKNKELEGKNIELKKLHKELKISNIQLKKSIDEKNYFLGIAAHDLRSPLCTISTCLHVVHDSLDKDAMDGQEMIFSAINETLDYMLNLITDVLDFAKIESSKLKLKEEKFNFIAFMDQAIELNNILSRQKNISILSAYGKGEIMLSADRNKLRQVMDNLLSNALKYSEKNTEIYIYVSSSDDEVLVKVIDQGKGIPESEIGNIFQPFVTTSVKTTAGEKSTGLGLVSVKKIIETHGGKIWVTSEVGTGSEFCFSIPIK